MLGTNTNTKINEPARVTINFLPNGESRCLTQTRFRFYFWLMYAPNMLASYRRRLAREVSLNPLFPQDSENGFFMKISLKDFLLQSKVDLDNKEQVAKAKALYRKTYLRNYMKSYNSSHKRRNITFSLEENRLLEKTAKVYKMKVAPFAKECIMAYLNQEYLVPDNEVVQQVEIQIRKVGNNINQIAYVANREKYISPGQIEHLKKVLFQMEDYVVQTLRTPKTLNQSIEEELQKNPSFISQLEYLISQHKSGL